MQQGKVTNLWINACYNTSEKDKMLSKMKAISQFIFEQNDPAEPRQATSIH